MKFLIITGRSGSGKSTCLHLLEDLDYYCIDNLPINLLPTLPETLEKKQKIAIGIDVRNLPESPEELLNILQQLRDNGVELEIIYLDTDEHRLFERFSSTRRKHPLSNPETSLPEALKQEVIRLEPLARMAAHRIDTTHLSIHQLHEKLECLLGVSAHSISVLFQSFGYKHGIPRDSDYVFDVRCLPNPYWEPTLRDRRGTDPEVQQFLNSYPMVAKMFNDIKTFIETWLPEYTKDNRNYMTISIGCTGGYHRSVFIAEQLYEYFKTLGTNIQLRHRELA
jgi:RNase adapter protein RapZ